MFIKCLYFLFGCFFLHFSANAMVRDLYRSNADILTREFKIDGVQFYVHYPKNKVTFTDEVEAVLKEDAKRIHDLFNYRPQQDVHILINHEAYTANGSARVFPQNVIVLYDYPPLNNQYLNYTSNWVRMLTFHEYTHIVTIDMTDGFIDVLRSIFGSWVKPNMLTPRWFSEGVAVWAESRLLPGEGGRLNNPLLKMEVWQKLSSPEFCSKIACLDSPGLQPFGNYAYWVGGYFLDYMEKKQPGFLACVFNQHGRSVPFSLYWQFKDCFSKDIHLEFATFREKFLAENDFRRGSCPLESELCQRLETENKLLYVSWESGYCDFEDKAYLVYNQRTSNQEVSYTMDILEVSSQAIRSYEHDVPISRLQKTEDQCLLFSYDSIYPVLKTNVYTIDQKELSLLKQESLTDAEYVDLDRGVFVASNYVDGKWLQKDRIVKADWAYGTKYPGKAVALAPKATLETETTDYSALRFMAPEYWFYSFGGSELYKYIGMSTSFQDPMQRNILNMAWDYVYDFSSDQKNEFTTTVSYLWQKGDWAFLTQYSRQLGGEDVDEVYHFDEQYDIAPLHIWQPEDMDIRLGPVWSKEKQSDDIGDRLAESKKLFVNINFISPVLGRATNLLSLNLLAGDYKAKDVDDFFGYYTSLETKTFLGHSSALGLRGSFARHDKEHSQGHIYKGGNLKSVSLISDDVYIPGLFPGEALGNELWSTSLDYKFNLAPIFVGKGMWPFYLDGLDLVMGVDYGDAEFLSLTEDYSNTHFTILRYGFNFQTHLLYLAPLNISVYFAQVMKPENLNRVIIDFGASF